MQSKGWTRAVGVALGSRREDPGLRGDRMHRRDGPETGRRAPRGTGSLVRDDRRAEGGGLALRMLELQRTAGNAATTALVRGAGAGRVVQRVSATLDQRRWTLILMRSVTASVVASPA
jgi:hypothetical protein